MLIVCSIKALMSQLFIDQERGKMAVAAKDGGGLPPIKLHCNSFLFLHDLQHSKKNLTIESGGYAMFALPFPIRSETFDIFSTNQKIF